MDAEDVEVNPLDVIFDLKKVLVGKEYFRINHLLPLLFNLVQGPTLRSKSTVPRPILKDSSFRKDVYNSLPFIYGGLYMEVYSTYQNECLLEKNNRRNRY